MSPAKLRSWKCSLRDRQIELYPGKFSGCLDRIARAPVPMNRGLRESQAAGEPLGQKHGTADAIASVGLGFPHLLRQGSFPVRAPSCSALSSSVCWGGAIPSGTPKGAFAAPRAVLLGIPTRSRRRNQASASRPSAADLFAYLLRTCQPRTTCFS